jgi:hypothetical protein
MGRFAKSWRRQQARADIGEAVGARSAASVDTANRPWPTSTVGQRTARVAPRKMACQPAREAMLISCGSRPSTRAQGGGGSLIAAPFYSGAKMDAKAKELSLIASLSLFCAGFAWILDQLVLGSVLFALGVVAVGAAWAR